MKSKQLIYLDNNSSTQIDSRVLESMMPFLTDQYANANSSHRFGVEIKKHIELSRARVANILNANPDEIVFTSGATESVNLALKGIFLSHQHLMPHFITVSTEHHAVLDTCKYLETLGCEVTYLPVSSDGLIDLIELEKSFRVNTILVSVMFANNETGVIQPIDEISKIAQTHGVLFMTDATQAVGKLPIDITRLNIDMLAFSGHKIHGPKGIGALYVNSRLKRRNLTTPLMHGGGHENSLRSGTLNVPGIVGLGKACEISGTEWEQNTRSIEPLRDFLEKEILDFQTTKLNGSADHRIYNTSNILFYGVDSDMIINRLGNSLGEVPGVAVSNGSACVSANIEPSHVLLAMGLSSNDASSSIRFSLSKFNTIEEIKITIREIRKIVSSI